MRRAADLTDVTWITSPYSGSDGGQCVTVGVAGAEGVPVRDSKDPAGPALCFPRAEWSAFLDTVRDDAR
ncbi:DUF397 domain-containing protein [Streptomyces sp. DSM 44915]|uniref:DUF397 domain-containing protein n=1 Tax=Streptomyces chisholmiae TaxID=3075540 RepID=A0ABU2JTW4_9ACTN|nr:DUF397 domain-containing protein [Streptomyces sp. DSM 44915]MDT0267949.1 DUF397 domain-containing protein [Streptomyces sp. DSM 44915]